MIGLSLEDLRNVVLLLGSASRPGNNTDMHQACFSEALKIIDKKIGEKPCD